ncbi:phage tail sheath C-terminal domain-containing protein [Streptomyces sp. I05A-00742]|uniref:phage tail sheath family protein n=1 Tax=Streptomyces sp. I05A-00742 TaxID=2732853 RepID=UPI001487E760|nr:phage tail sheath C-terminal domain-containing protein [Streptomyces sp. I05A-00742]
MLNLTYPGVYTRELDSGVRTVTGAPTSTALFMGPTLRGIDERTTTCLSFADFERNFGGLYDKSSLSYSVMHFFANGGGRAEVQRLPVSNAVKAESRIGQSVTTANPSLAVTALSSGSASGSLFLEIDPFGIGAHPYSTTPPHDTKRFNLTVVDPVTGAVERFADLTTQAGNARTVDTVLGDPDTGSRLVEVKLLGAGAAGPQPTGSVYRIEKDAVAGDFDKDYAVSLSVIRRGADGKEDAASSVKDLAVTVFKKGAKRPPGRLELVNQLVVALNRAIHADAARRAKLAGASVEGELCENGAFLRLTISRPDQVPGAERVHDATVTIGAPAAAAGASLLEEYKLTVLAANPSRYRLGHPYDKVVFGGTDQILVSDTKSGLDGDADGQPSTDAFKSAVTALDALDPFFNLLCLPDLVRPSVTNPKSLHHTGASAVYAEAARVCARKFAFLIVDPPPFAVDIRSASSWKSTKLGFRSSHAGAWFPNIRVDDPLHPGTIVSHPPSGAVAGVIARTDNQVGVWQAPAGTDAFLAGVYGPSVEMSDGEQGLLNPLGLNVIRRFPLYQTVAFGSRTVDGADALASQWKYIPVRRTANHILRSLSDSLRWAVHQRNGEELWSQLRVNCTAFLHGLFRQGAFKGVSARDAYFVACDASTTTPGDIDQGIVNIVIGFAPLKPAEFVVISLKQIVQPAV